MTEKLLEEVEIYIDILEEMREKAAKMLFMLEIAMKVHKEMPFSILSDAKSLVGLLHRTLNLIQRAKDPKTAVTAKKLKLLPDLRKEIFEKYPLLIEHTKKYLSQPEHVDEVFWPYFPFLIEQTTREEDWIHPLYMAAQEFNIILTSSQLLPRVKELSSPIDRVNIAAKSIGVDLRRASMTIDNLGMTKIQYTELTDREKRRYKRLAHTWANAAPLRKTTVDILTKHWPTAEKEMQIYKNSRLIKRLSKHPIFWFLSDKTDMIETVFHFLEIPLPGKNELQELLFVAIVRQFSNYDVRFWDLINQQHMLEEAFTSYGEKKNYSGHMLTRAVGCLLRSYEWDEVATKIFPYILKRAVESWRMFPPQNQKPVIDILSHYKNVFSDQVRMGMYGGLEKVAHAMPFNRIAWKMLLEKTNHLERLRKTGDPHLLFGKQFDHAHLVTPIDVFISLSRRESHREIEAFPYPLDMDKLDPDVLIGEHSALLNALFDTTMFVFGNNFRISHVAAASEVYNRHFFLKVIDRIEELYHSNMQNSKEIVFNLLLCNASFAHKNPEKMQPDHIVTVKVLDRIREKYIVRTILSNVSLVPHLLMYSKSSDKHLIGIEKTKYWEWPFHITKSLHDKDPFVIGFKMSNKEMPLFNLDEEAFRNLTIYISSSHFIVPSEIEKIIFERKQELYYSIFKDQIEKMSKTIDMNIEIQLEKFLFGPLRTEEWKNLLNEMGFNPSFNGFVTFYFVRLVARAVAFGGMLLPMRFEGEEIFPISKDAPAAITVQKESPAAIVVTKHGPRVSAPKIQYRTDITVLHTTLTQLYYLTERILQFNNHFNNSFSRWFIDPAISRFEKTVKESTDTSFDYYNFFSTALVGEMLYQIYENNVSCLSCWREIYDPESDDGTPKRSPKYGILDWLFYIGTILKPIRQKKIPTKKFVEKLSLQRGGNDRANIVGFLLVLATSNVTEETVKSIEENIAFKEMWAIRWLNKAKAANPEMPLKEIILETEKKLLDIKKVQIEREKDKWSHDLNFFRRTENLDLYKASMQKIKDALNVGLN